MLADWSKINSKHLKCDCFVPSAKGACEFPNRTVSKAESAFLFLEYILCDEHYCSPDCISYILIMFTNKSEFTKCLAPEEAAVSRGPQTSPLWPGPEGGVRAGPRAVLPLGPSQVGLGPRVGLPRTQAGGGAAAG